MFRRNREGLYLVLVMQSTGADNTDIKIDEKMQKFLFVYFYLEYPLSLESEIWPIKSANLSSL